MPAQTAVGLVPPGALDAREVQAHLRAARDRVLALTADLDGARLLGPKLATVNPVQWELGHVAWFQEYWCLRLRSDGSRARSVVDGADDLYDSTAIPHEVRWHLPLLSPEATRAYLAAVLEQVSNALEDRPDDERLLYFAELAACHEDMHAEAFHYTRQTLAYPAPQLSRRVAPAPAPGAKGDVEFAAGRFQVGATPGSGFVHDNEKWAHEVVLAPFRIARMPVSNAEFVAFVEAGGYVRREWWTDEGWRWRESVEGRAPRYWEKRGGVWGERRFDDWQDLITDEPVMHVTAFEAEAYCRFAERRLPTEAEWEYAACDGRDAPKPATPWGAPRPSLERANLEGAGRAPVGTFAAGDTPRGFVSCSGTSGNGPRRPSNRIPASCPTPIRNTPSHGSVPTGSCGAGASRRRSVSCGTPGVISTHPIEATS